MATKETLSRIIHREMMATYNKRNPDRVMGMMMTQAEIIETAERIEKMVTRKEKKSVSSSKPESNQKVNRSI